MATNAPKDPQKLVDSGKICEMLSITNETLYRLVNNGRVKGYRLLRAYRFDPEEVMAALREEDDEEPKAAEFPA